MQIQRKNYRAHRLTYAFAHGEIPVGLQIDHKCRVRDCVNPDHLQAVTTKQNMENRTGPPSTNTSGVLNVSWHKGAGKWWVNVRHNGKTYSGGYHTDIDDAEQAAIALRNRLFTNNLKDRE